MLLPPSFPCRRLPVLTNLVESGEEARRPEVFTPGITALAVSTGVVMGVFLAVGSVVSVLSARMMRPIEFTSVGGVCVEFVELITVRCTVLGR